MQRPDNSYLTAIYPPRVQGKNYRLAVSALHAPISAAGSKFVVRPESWRRCRPGSLGADMGRSVPAQMWASEVRCKRGPFPRAPHSPTQVRSQRIVVTLKKEDEHKHWSKLEARLRMRRYIATVGSIINVCGAG